MLSLVHVIIVHTSGFSLHVSGLQLGEGMNSYRRLTFVLIDLSLEFGGPQKQSHVPVLCDSVLFRAACEYMPVTRLLTGMERLSKSKIRCFSVFSILFQRWI